MNYAAIYLISEYIVWYFAHVFWTCIISAVTAGENVITRKSSESSVTIPDIPSFAKLIHDANDAISHGTELHNEQVNSTLVKPF